MISLPLLTETRRSPAPADLVRLYHRLELHWSRALAEEMPLDAGTAFVNPDLPGVPAANRLLDAVLPANLSAAQAMQHVNGVYTGQGARCLHWVPNPAAPPARSETLRIGLEAQGLRSVRDDILYLDSAPARLPPARSDLQVLPARAAFRQARALAEQAAAGEGRPAVFVEAAMLHLDDPHYECLLALEGGQPVGRAGLLTVGELGLIQQFYVLPRYRRQSVGTTLLNHLVALAARALLRHVLLSIAHDNGPARALFSPFGFTPIGTFEVYRPA